MLDLNFKALEIKHIQDDKDSVIKLLDVIDKKTTLKELKEKIELIKIRKDQVNHIKNNIENTNNNIDKIKNELKVLEKEYKNIINCIDDKFRFIEENIELTDNKKAQILKSIAYSKTLEQYVFVGFIDINKYFYLKNKGIINYDEDYISYRGYLPPPTIPDINKFINYVKKSKGFDAEFQTKYTKSKNLIWANRKDKELKELTSIKDKLKEKKRT